MKGDHPGEIPAPGPMNVLGVRVRNHVLEPRHIPYRASAATNSITLYSPLHWVSLITEFAVRGGPTASRLVPVSVRSGTPEAGPEVAFMLRAGPDSVRIRVGDDAAKLVRRFGSPAIRASRSGSLFWDTAAWVDLGAMGQALLDLGELPEPAD